MAIIKNGRINLWNAVKKQFEVVHPETETARITDFADGIVQKLALTSAMTAVTALQTDSWFGKLLKMALTDSGVKYSIAENGYVCFGELFGGLIIQWGYDGSNSQINGNISSYEVTIPINCSSAFAWAAGGSGDDATNILSISKGIMTVRTFRSLNTSPNDWVKRPFRYIIICK